MQCVHIPTELPFCILPLLVGRGGGGVLEDFVRNRKCNFAYEKKGLDAAAVAAAVAAGFIYLSFAIISGCPLQDVPTNVHEPYLVVYWICLLVLGTI